MVCEKRMVVEGRSIKEISSNLYLGQQANEWLRLNVYANYKANDIGSVWGMKESEGFK